MRLKRAEEKKAIEAFAKENPNSFVADLLICFDKDIVLRLLEFYSGRRVQIPVTKNIWINYRNRRIKEFLDENNTRDRREMLAENFGLSENRIRVIYREISKRLAQRIKHRTIKNLVNTIFKKNL